MSRPNIPLVSPSLEGTVCIEWDTVGLTISATGMEVWMPTEHEGPVDLITLERLLQ